MRTLSRSLGSLLIGLGAGVTVAAAQSDTPRIEVRRLDAATAVLMPSERSSNMIVWSGPEGVVIVDNMADTMAAELERSLGRETVRRTRYVFNTHWHHNHVGGNALFSDHASVLAPAPLRDRLMTDQRLVFLVDQTFPRLPESGWPNTTFRDSVTVFVNGAAVRVWFTPGHTDSDAVVYLAGPNVLALGDLYTSNGWILPDLDTGGSMLGVADALRHALTVAPRDAVVVPGHGALSTMDALADYDDGLRAAIRHVRAAHQRGLTLSETQQLETSGAVARFLGANPARMVEAIYRSFE